MTLHAKRGLIQISRYGYFHGPGREIEKNYWNVSEISLSRREIFDARREYSRREIFHAVKKATVTVRLFHAMKRGHNV